MKLVTYNLIGFYTGFSLLLSFGWPSPSLPLPPSSPCPRLTLFSPNVLLFHLMWVSLSLPSSPPFHHPKTHGSFLASGLLQMRIPTQKSKNPKLSSIYERELETFFPSLGDLIQE